MLAAHTDAVTAVAVSADSVRAVTGSNDHTARVWNLISGQCEHVLAAHTHAVTAVAVSADGADAVTGSNDHTARVWNLAAGCQLASLTMPAQINALAATQPDLDLIVCGDMAGGVHILKLRAA